MARNHLYLVDGSGYIFRAYHRLPPLTNPQGVPVGAVYGYTAMLWKLADGLDKAEGPTHLAVILDHSAASFRNEMYDQYKAHRPEPPSDLVPQFPLIRDATRAFSLPCIELEGYEADDLIAAYTTQALGLGWDVTIVSGDKDLMQLVTPDKGDGSPHVDLYDTMKNARIDVAAVEEKFGVGPDRLADVLALMGDSVDNVPGIAGIGPKTAAKLIQEHGDLESALAAAATMKPGKLRDNLIQFADDARLSRQLVELCRDCPTPEPLESFKLDGIPPDPLRAFLLEHGFRAMANRLEGGAASGPVRRSTMVEPLPGTARGQRNAARPPSAGEGLPKRPDIDHSRYSLITTAGQLDIVIAAARQSGTLGLHVVSDTSVMHQPLIVGLGLAIQPGQAAYVPLGHRGADLLAAPPQQLDTAAAIAQLAPLLADASVLKVGHDLKPELLLLGEAGVCAAGYDDTILLSFALDAGNQGHGFEEVARRLTGHEPLTAKGLTGSGRNAVPLAAQEPAAVMPLACERAELALRMHEVLKDRLWREGATRVYEMVDRGLVTTVARMERRGVLVDRAELAQLSEVFSTETAKLETAIFAEAGGPFTIGSPKQLGEVLFDRLGLKGGRKGKSGEYSTDQSELERLERDGVKVARQVLEWRQLTKLRSTYTDALQQQIDPVTGRVHTRYSLTGAQTGRLSSTDPNLQNIPIRTVTGRQIREAFVAAPGNVLIAADYSQIELRLAAHMADVPQLKEAFLEGADIHNRTAQELFGEVTRDTRAKAKTVNFAILYGISRWGLASRLEIGQDEAQAIISRYFERFPGISDYMQRTLEEVRSCGYTQTLFGRRTWFPRINSRNQAERAGAERAAINAPIQGTSADIIKRAMTRMDKALGDAGLGEVKMLLQVHDELLFEAPEGLVEAATPVIRETMANAAGPSVTLDVPLGVDVGFGKSWGDAH